MNKPEFSIRELAPCLFAILVDVLGFGVVTPLLVALFTDVSRDYFQIAGVQWRYFYLGLTLALYGLLMFFGTSFILGPLMGGILSNWSLTLPFYGAAVCAALSAGWIALAFEETCTRGPISRVRLSRVVELFVEAYRHERIRKLGGAFLLMQIAVSLFFPLLLVYFSE